MTGKSSSSGSIARRPRSFSTAATNFRSSKVSWSEDCPASSGAPTRPSPFLLGWSWPRDSTRAGWAFTDSATARDIPTTRCGSPTPGRSGRRSFGITSARPAAGARSSACRRATRPTRWPAISFRASSRRPARERKRLFLRVSRGRSRSASAPTSSTSSSGPRTATRSSARSTP